MTQLLAQTRLFGRRHEGTAALARALEEAGFSPTLGFETLRDDADAPLERLEAPTLGSLLVVDDGRVEAVIDWLREQRCTVGSMYLVVLADLSHEIDIAADSW